jgi:hypothetical protein
MVLAQRLLRPVKRPSVHLLCFFVFVLALQHKSKIVDAREYMSAAMAAAYAKAILLEIPPKKMEVSDSSQSHGNHFNGPISGRNVFPGMTTSGGTVNLNLY